MAREFYRRPDHIRTPLSTKAEVSNAVKEALVETMKRFTDDANVMLEAGKAAKNAIAKYERQSPQDDELRHLSDLATFAVEKAMRTGGVTDENAIDTFKHLLAEHLPPFPEPINRAPPSAQEGTSPTV